MVILRGINKENKRLLKRISTCSKYGQVRNRAKCIILLEEGWSIAQVIKIFEVSRKTIYNWVSKWEKEGVLGLYNQKGRGRKPLLNQEQENQVKEWVKQEPKNLQKVIDKIHKAWSIKLHKETVKRIIKKLKMTWRRMKRGLSKEAEEWELEVKLPRLREFLEQEQKGEIDLRYLDQSGFSLTPYIPYGWQEEKETLILKSRPGQRINVMGLMSRTQELDYQIIKGSINSQKVINFLDKYHEKIEKKTIIILDQASIHTSDAFVAKYEEWKQNKMEVFWLPAYSPELNLIEILWKFIKYEWIEIEAYNSQKSLIEYLKKVLDNFGSQYVINFV